jgi:ATP-dependent Lon protease
MMSPMSAEATVVRNYIDWILSLPWEERTKEKMDIKEAERILDEDHYGLKKPKERILEYLAVQALTKKISGPILCLVGPRVSGRPPSQSPLPGPRPATSCAFPWAA